MFDPETQGYLFRQELETKKRKKWHSGGVSGEGEEKVR